MDFSTSQQGMFQGERERHLPQAQNLRGARNTVMKVNHIRTQYFTKSMQKRKKKPHVSY